MDVAPLGAEETPTPADCASVETADGLEELEIAVTSLLLGVAGEIAEGAGQAWMGACTSSTFAPAPTTAGSLAIGDLAWPLVCAPARSAAGVDCCAAGDSSAMSGDMAAGEPGAGTCTVAGLPVVPGEAPDMLNS